MKQLPLIGLSFFLTFSSACAPINTRSKDGAAKQNEMAIKAHEERASQQQKTALRSQPENGLNDTQVESLQAAKLVYFHRVKKEIELYFIWPKSGKNFVTLVMMKIDSDGNLLDTKITKSSGNFEYDQAVMRAIEKSAPLPPPPSEIAKVLTYEVAIGLQERQEESKELEKVQLQEATEELEKVRQQKEQAESKAKTEKVTLEYEQFLKTNKCETNYWQRYKRANQIKQTAESGKISPYDLAFGDEYTRRNVSSILRIGIGGTIWDYLRDMPNISNDKFKQEFPNKQDEKANKTKVFNTSVKRDHECYLKLK